MPPAAIKVGASDQGTLYTIVTPVGPYFSNGVSLLAVGEHVRSWPGGTGGFKLGLNYSPGFIPQQSAAALGYDQVLWRLGLDKQITEAGAMNFFAVTQRADGDSAIVLLRAHGADPGQKLLNLPADMPVYVEERVLTVNELAAWAKAGTQLECFGTDTAVLVVAIERIGDVDAADGKTLRDIDMKAGKGLGPAVGQALWDKLLALKEGRENFGRWNVLCE
ncbi:aminotransferase [Mycena leptocephala]|nr:aminotransferase [Mycena leptocephala]